MLKLILKKQVREFIDLFDLNTSHVKVNPKIREMDGKLLQLFKYISC